MNGECFLIMLCMVFGTGLTFLIPNRTGMDNTWFVDERVRERGGERKGEEEGEGEGRKEGKKGKTKTSSFIGFIKLTSPHEQEGKRV